MAPSALCHSVSSVAIFVQSECDAGQSFNRENREKRESFHACVVRVFRGFRG